MSYEPKIEVVRRSPLHYQRWVMDDGRYLEKERAYLVRGVPMPGERVMDRDGTVYTVRNPEVQWVEVDDRSHRLIKVLRLKALRPYDPDAERLRVATEAVRRVNGSAGFKTHEEIARAVDEAYRKGGFLKEVDDG